MVDFRPIVFERVRDVGDVLNATFAFIRQHFIPLGKSVLFIAGPFILLAGFAAGYFQTAWLRLLGSEDPTELIEGGGIFQMGAGMILLSLFGMLALFLVTAVAYSYVRLYVAGTSADGLFETFEPGEVWAQLKEDLGTYISTSALLLLLFVVAIFIALIPCLGILVVMIGGVYLMVALSPIYMVRLEEGASFGEAIRRCRYLVEGFWGSTFGLLFVLWVVQVILSLIFTMPQQIMQWIIMFNAAESGASGFSNLLIMMMSLFTTLSYFLSVIFPIAVGLHYYNLVERKDATGLQERVARINLDDE